MPAPANLVHQQSTSTGTGNFTLSTVNGKQSFDTAFGHAATTNVFDYFISNQGAAEWERGTGHMSDATTLVRDTVIESTNSNAAVSFSAGTKDVVNDVPAAKQVTTDTTQTLTNKTLTDPIVGTQTARDNSTKAASTAYVDGAFDALAVSAFDYVPANLQAAITAGTSTTDVQSYLQSAATAAAGKKLVIPPGLYNLSAKVDLSSNTLVDAWGATFKATSGNVDSFATLIRSNAKSNILVRGLTLDGNISNIAGTNNVVTVFNSTNVIFDQCTFQNCKGVAYLVSGSTACGTTRCQYSNCGTSDSVQALAYTSSCVNAIVMGNVFNTVGLDCISIASVTGGICYGNTIKTAGAAGVYVTTSQGITIANNNIATGSSGGSGIDTSGNKGVTITGNICIGNGGAGILVGNELEITATGNICKNNGKNASTTSTSGIFIISQTSSVSAVRIQGNICSDDQGASATQFYGIDVYNSSPVGYSNVRIDDTNVLNGYDSGGTSNPAKAINNSSALGPANFRNWSMVKKTGDQAKTSDATLANDSSLYFAMLASTSYNIRIRVYFSASASGDFKYALSGPSSPNRVRVVRKHIDPSALTSLVVASETAYTSSTAIAAGSSTNGGWVEMDILVINGTNAGTFAFQWAQNTSDASATTVLAESYLEYMIVP